ncbi:MAG: phage major capsid protein [Bacteroidales bacterium]|jgi:HK97 family phage major capsid protein|nr:phage major capsid protein [Bacteroidales bacterium]
MKRLAEIILRIKEIEVEVRDGNATDEMNTELDTLLVEKKELEAKEAEMRAKFAEGTQLPTFEERTPQANVELEQREAFRNYVMTGEETDALLRADATTATTDIGAIIPNTILSQIIEEMADVGEIWNLVTKTNYPGGVDIPTASAKPVATWVAEGAVAEKQKKALGKISFSYYKLQIKVAITLIAATVSLDIWETSVAGNIAEALVLALETAIIEGTGTGQPLGFTLDARVPAAQIVEFAAADATFDGWITKLLSNIPLAYRKKKTGIILMNSGTWDKYVQGLVDTNGQPIARMTMGLDGEMQYRFLGKKVLLRDEITNLVGAGLSEVVCAYIDLKDYLVNTNLQITTRRYFDEDTDEYVQKSTMICDGKLADAYGVVLLKTAAV